MECNKCNRNIRYAIFRDSNLKSNFECFAKSNEIIFPYFFDRFCKLKRLFPFLDPLFFKIFGRFVKTKCRTFLRMALKCFNRIQVTSRWRIQIEKGSCCKNGLPRTLKKNKNRQFVTLLLHKDIPVAWKVIFWKRKEKEKSLLLRKRLLEQTWHLLKNLNTVTAEVLNIEDNILFNDNL